MISRASTAPIASSSSPVLGLADWPPWTTAATPKSRKIAARPSPGDDRDDAQGRRLAPATRRVALGDAAVGRERPSGASPVKAAARVSRTSRAWLSRFSMLIRLSAPTLSPYPIDQVRSLVVDVDLERPAVARHEHRLADRSRGGRGWRRRRAPPEPLGWSRNIVS